STSAAATALAIEPARNGDAASTDSPTHTTTRYSPRNRPSRAPGTPNRSHPSRSAKAAASIESTPRHYDEQAATTSVERRPILPGSVGPAHLRREPARSARGSASDARLPRSPFKETPGHLASSDA